MRFSIIMPVLNEEVILEEQLRRLAQQCAPYDCELLVVDGGSRDDTMAIAARFGRVVHASRGRALQMNAGAAEATGDILLFLHADTCLPDTAFDAIERALQSLKVVGGAFRVSFDSDKAAYQFVSFSTNLRSRLSKVFTGDQAYFIRTSSFHQIGGYPDQPLMEDLEIIARLRRIGRVVLLREHIVTSARRHQKIGLLRSVLFMWYLRLLYKFGVSPARLQQMYVDIR